MVGEEGTWMARIWVAIVLLVGIYVNLFGLWLYRKPGEATKWSRFQRWVGQFEFSPEALGGFSYTRLAIVSLFGLFLELLMIRWVSSEIAIFAYFKNFVLVACYLGFGLGCYLSKRRINLLALCVPLIALALLCELPSDSLHDTVRQLADVIGAISQVNYWGVPSLPLNFQTLAGAYTGSLFVVFVFGVVALLFVPVGQLVGWLLENAPDGIYGYTLNVLASLAGIVLFTLLCFEFQPPATWFLVAGGLAVYFLWRLPNVRWLAVATFLFCVVLTSLPAAKDTMVFWSPYQKLTIETVRDDAGKIMSTRVHTNSTFYEDTLNLSDSFVAAHPNYYTDETGREAGHFKLSDLAAHYNLPYRFYPHPSSVLVLGSGTGNDVAAALRNGAGDVTAVEIDPVILQEGRKLHFEQPYSSPRVHAVLNDARSYLQNSNQRFDVIVFAFLDSHTTSSYYSTIRIDNYVYTLEALRRAKTLLKPDGVMVIKFAALNPWIAGRLNELATTVFGRPPLQLQSGRLMIVGSQERIARALKDPTLAAYVTANGNVQLQSASLTTDDWPYFYQHEPGIPASVIIILSVLIALCCLLLGKTGTSVRSLHWHFFFLGAAFMLLEAHIVSQMALLFGTTWLVNSIVISGLLVLIVAANLIVHWRPATGVTLAYLGIFASIVVTYIVPPEAFFLSSFWAKAFVSTAVLCLPVFFAGIVFIVSFAREGFRSDALGSNLFGALVGGMLESMSMWTGMRSILILVALFYALSWIVLLRQASRVEESESVPNLGAARV
jgi:SAM-dependent methyltransferase